MTRTLSDKAALVGIVSILVTFALLFSINNLKLASAFVTNNYFVLFTFYAVLLLAWVSFLFAAYSQVLTLLRRLKKPVLSHILGWLSVIGFVLLSWSFYVSASSFFDEDVTVRIALVDGSSTNASAHANSVTCDSSLSPASYGAGFSNNYSTVEQDAPSFPDGLPMEDPVVIYSPLKHGWATVERTLGSEVPYERSIGIVTVEHKFGDPIHFVSTGFRTITVTWIGERYVRFDKGIGHIVSIEEIFDLVDRKWLVRHTISYRWP